MISYCFKDIRFQVHMFKILQIFEIPTVFFSCKPVGKLWLLNRQGTVKRNLINSLGLYCFTFSIND